ncbi:MAG TPA: hypothetical protein VKQ36_08230 [Ktedonobacterales bacterium]|nr:hypothetical protein [Ktedonobacterales bacterium]
MPRLFRRTTMRRAIIEGIIIYTVGLFVALIPIGFWPAPIFPLVLVARLALWALPPIWAALRVVSTRREKMSRRFWRLGPTLAALCGLINMLIALCIGEAQLYGGLAGEPDIVRLTTHGTGALSFGAFALTMLAQLGWLLVYYTIAVICTRLANGGFLRFTMPAGDGRVTL